MGACGAEETGELLEAGKLESVFGAVLAGVEAAEQADPEPLVVHEPDAREHEIFIRLQ